MGVFSSRRNQWFAALLTVLVLVLVYVNLISPARQERAAKEKLLAQRQAELEALKKRTAGAQALGAEEQVNLSRVRGQIPEVPDLEGLIRNVRMLETVSRMQLANYNFEIGSVPSQASSAKPGGSEAGSAAAGPTLAVPIRLNTTAKGDYEQIHRFLEEVQTSQRLIQVDKMTFAVKSAPPVKLNAAKREMTFTVSLVSYYAPGMQKFFKTPLPVDYTKPEGKPNPI
jgi:Tfp pilus assembly protein PilO